MYYLIHCLASFLSLSKMSQSYKCSARPANIPDKSQKLKKTKQTKKVGMVSLSVIISCEGKWRKN